MARPARIFPLFFLLFLVVSACGPAEDTQLGIGFSADSSAIVFTHIDQAGLLQLKNAKLSDSAWNHLIAILQSPSENDSLIKEMPVAGHIHFAADKLIFKPGTPLVKGRDYLVITHLNSRFGDMKNMAKGELSTRVKPIQKLLSR